MSGRSSSGTGWEGRSGTPPWVYALVGVLLTLAVVLAIVVIMLLGNGSQGLASATSTPTAAAGATGAATAGPTATPAVASTHGPTATPVSGQTPAPTAPAATSAPGASGSPNASTKPTLVSMTVVHKADCNTDYGNGVGQIQISWQITGATGVRISIDPPSPATAYGYGFADYPADTTSAWVPFACNSSLHDSGGSYHLYVVTTLHTTGYYQYRYAKVYQSPAPTATP